MRISKEDFVGDVATFFMDEVRKVAIQGERGSNSHVAALAMLGDVEIVPCTVSAQVIDAVLEGRVDAAVLPIENSLHGSVAEHYDLLLAAAIRIDYESLLRIRHNVIVASGVKLSEVTEVMSHPVALSQCRKWLHAHPEIRVVPFYDTAGSVKQVVGAGIRTAAGIAPALAAEEYGGEVIAVGIEDNAENFTRFHLLRREGDARPAGLPEPNKVSVAFVVDHRPGTLVSALQRLAESGVDLTKIESRPVPGKPWEYVFYVDFRFSAVAKAEVALQALRAECSVVKELGRYAAASD